MKAYNVLFIIAYLFLFLGIRMLLSLGAAFLLLGIILLFHAYVLGIYNNNK